MMNQRDPQRAEFEGYASVFNSPDLSGDVVRPGAFGQSGRQNNLILADPPRVIMLYQHTVDRPIGRWTTIKQDTKGLWVRGTLFLDTPDGMAVHRLLLGGALDGLSVGFKPKRSRRLSTGQRELLSVELWEISVVTFPMAPDARVTRIGDAGETLPRNLLQ